jgi:Skp family chaperone for outer membrane proteins
MKKLPHLKFHILIFMSLMILGAGRIVRAIEIPLDAITPVRVGYVDLQKVFDTYPEKSFAEGDLLKEIQKRKQDLVRRQTDINALRQQIAADQSALDQAQARRPVTVPRDALATEETEPAAPEIPVTPPKTNTSTTTVEPYPTDEPLAGLPGHEVAAPAANAQAPAPRTTRRTASPMLDLLASTTGPTLLKPEAMAALDKRLAENRKTLNRALMEFRDFRGKAVDDMKVLQTQKTYGVMSKIYAILQTLARDESVMVVLDKAYVLYGEDTIDLTDKLISRLQGEPQG